MNHPLPHPAAIRAAEKIIYFINGTNGGEGDCCSIEHKDKLSTIITREYEPVVKVLQHALLFIRHNKGYRLNVEIERAELGKELDEALKLISPHPDTKIVNGI